MPPRFHVCASAGCRMRRRAVSPLRVRVSPSALLGAVHRRRSSSSMSSYSALSYSPASAGHAPDAPEVRARRPVSWCGWWGRRGAFMKMASSRDDAPRRSSATGCTCSPFLSRRTSTSNCPRKARSSPQLIKIGAPPSRRPRRGRCRLGVFLEIFPNLNFVKMASTRRHVFMKPSRRL